LAHIVVIQTVGDPATFQSPVSPAPLKQSSQGSG
jgi:hypothetical protein